MLYLDLETVKHAFWSVFMRNPKIPRKYLFYSHRLPEKLSLSRSQYLGFSSDSSCESSPDTPASVHQCLNSGHPEKNQLSSCLGWESAEDESDFERWQLAWLGALMCHLYQLMLDVYGLAFLMCLFLWNWSASFLSIDSESQCRTLFDLKLHSSQIFCDCELMKQLLW